MRISRFQCSLSSAQVQNHFIFLHKTLFDSLSRYIRMSSPSLNNLILVGCMLAYVSMIFMGINSSLFTQGSHSQTLMNIICPVSRMIDIKVIIDIFVLVRHEFGFCASVLLWHSVRCSAKHGAYIRSLPMLM